MPTAGREIAPPVAAAPASPPAPPLRGGLLPYLRLVRAPAVFTALGDPLAGMLIARDDLPLRRAGAATAAAASLYLAGMALNDLADRELDAVERPERPIPAGQVSARAATAVGSTLLVAGMLAARCSGAVRTGATLAAAITAYDFALKGSQVLGPLTMGSCRSLSLLMGAEAAGDPQGVRRARGAALLLGAYVTGLTLLARGETGNAAGSVAAGAAVALAAVLATAARSGRRAAPWAGAVLALAGPTVARAVRQPTPPQVGAAVGAMIRAIPALDAALVAARSPRRALVMLPLLGLVRWGRKLIPIS